VSARARVGVCALARTNVILLMKHSFNVHAEEAVVFSKPCYLKDRNVI
jgi:hypothetical protein